MCVLLRGVWSLKKARLRCDRLCWWPLNFNTLHNYTCIIIDKVILPKSGEISHHLKVPAQQAWTWAGLRPTRTIGFDKPPGGRTNRTVEKQRANHKSLSWFVTLLALGSWLSGTSLFNIAGAALVTSLPARALTWTLSRHRLNQPSIRRRRLEGTTSKNNELNAYGWKDSFLWRHAAAATSLVFPPESIRRSPNHPRGLRGQRPEQRILRKRNNFQPAS